MRGLAPKSVDSSSSLNSSGSLSQKCPAECFPSGLGLFDCAAISPSENFHTLSVFVTLNSSNCFSLRISLFFAVSAIRMSEFLNPSSFKRLVNLDLWLPLFYPHFAFFYLKFLRFVCGCFLQISVSITRFYDFLAVLTSDWIALCLQEFLSENHAKF